MGQLSRWQINRLSTISFSNYVETGTGLGVSLSHAIAEKSIKCFYSIDNDLRFTHSPELRRLLESTLSADQNVQLLNCESDKGLLHVLPNLSKAATLFFLDAHFPHADFFNLPYRDSIVTYQHAALPLIRELSLISMFRSSIPNDLIIVDDLLLFENGDYEFDRTHPAGAQSIRDTLRKNHLYLDNCLEPIVRHIFGVNVTLERDYQHQGYLLIRY